MRVTLAVFLQPQRRVWSKWLRRWALQLTIDSHSMMFAWRTEKEKFKIGLDKTVEPLTKNRIPTSHPWAGMAMWRLLMEWTKSKASKEPLLQSTSYTIQLAKAKWERQSKEQLKQTTPPKMFRGFSSLELKTSWASNLTAQSHSMAGRASMPQPKAISFLAYSKSKRRLTSSGTTLAQRLAT